ncbi:hypothetical protein DI005_05390 [Prauserella sp. PE36]|uniref:MmpS family membrane protein n=1 Tax=Prauserella endophytica TaxID=1592324 RepID=A0ABY2S7X6_9PSEU|nr:MULTISPECIES: hypothetical protein [Prauserella]PXY30122.1 hypothetical protein BAY59_12950 [Prauserella coralliicola]RBM22577.1 hypothetical protein DI005_05390 [Prauserella sp. PE36]TKG71190.1 hypothetical protein FCN18_13855 [Prauserella endophytica]
MVRAVLAVLIAVAVLATGVASTAFAPAGRQPAAAPKRAPQAHEIRIMVSGPDDTLMRVARGASWTQVALRGKPFDHSFTEPAGGDGYLGIRVAAASARPDGTPVRCAIRVDGVVVSEKSAVERDESGLAQVLCTIPRPI